MTRSCTVDGTCSSQRVVVRDYARRGTPRIIARAQRIKALAATGHFVAWVQRTRRTERPHWTYTIVVYDRSRNRVAYRIPNFRVAGPFERPGGRQDRGPGRRWHGVVLGR